MVARRAVVPGAMVLAAWLVPVPPALAQKPIPETVRMMEPHLLRIGDKVRAWPTPASRAVEGTIVGVGSDSVTVATREEAVLLTLPSLDRMQVRRTRSHVRRAAAIGAGVGLIASFLLVTEELLGRDLDAGERIAWTAGLVGAGAAAGAGAGYLTRSVTWHPVDLVTLRPHPTPVRPALRLSWTVRF
ncbi:MAG TPA: hypothetical protein VMR21_10755 [Vicinamibacteria bacterium]|nr:hypothetical protein [Vicinamibacteria bacterium]